MLDAVVGAVIMVVATTSLLYSIQVAERAFDQAGRYRLSEDEKELLRSAGVINPAEVDGLWRGNIESSPREVGLNE